ncbi:MAG: hypothetical protein K0S78_1093 [Thermomicrobiales bacterium]|nr:hypothetical protein [Thermomicrobiales bacterium]
MTFSDAGAVRIEVLQRLAEQAMNDAEFRGAARDDLPGALERYGYDLTAQEMALVVRFRRSLEDAGVDLDLVDGMGDDRLAQILDRLQRHAQSAGLS